MKKTLILLVALMLSSTAAFGFTFLNNDILTDGAGPDIYSNSAVRPYTNYFPGASLAPPPGDLDGTALTDLLDLHAGFIYVVEITPPEEPTTSAVPEPATIVLFALGMLGAGIVRRKIL
ncbi:MAG: PEP-CTERM sorting domain-containing protein [candidate division Zixibacteria bacterium]|nr:PEP-CTERM sorting domain-containing protein [candidate division Zixibacteria bacterium]